VTMRLYQPVLFVGLGGTGCLVGAELERRLRDEICGPDGADFKRRRPQAQHLPYQLPSCLQFVYADVNQAELDRHARQVVPGLEHIPAVLQTAHYVRDLVPQVDTYPRVAESLRLSAGPVVASWLPGPVGEPKVAPLQRGAGQLPTIGRAALFETFRNGLNPALRDLNTAVGRLSNSGEDLSFLNGSPTPPTAVDVFVAFSVAGGTGAGIFFDYLHLIGRVFESTQLQAQIYPLVLMPSAFAEGLGGGRAAQLNAGRALLDLFRLVDEQNGGDIDRNLQGSVAGQEIAVDPDDVAVHYPQEGRVKLRPSTVQTAFLFSLPVGAQRDDLHRSLVSLVLSLVGSELDENGSGGATSQMHQSFADSFINSGAERQVPAPNGIGGRGVSTALVASLTIPDDELADLVAGRILRQAVEELRAPLAAQENNRPFIERFFAVSGIGDIFTRPAADYSTPEPVSSAKDIAAALDDRVDSMKTALSSLDARLKKRVPEMVTGFDPREGVRALLGELDLFRVQRVLLGDSRLRGAIDRNGVDGVLTMRQHEPASSQNFHVTPPATPEMKDRFRVLRVQWTDPLPVQAREEQDQWYGWRTKTLWSQHWRQYTPRWRNAFDQACASVTALTEQLELHARTDRERFDARAEDLARPRVGVSYLLPNGGGHLDQFYERVRQRMITTYAGQMQLPPAATDAELLRVVIGDEGWRQCFQQTREFSDEQVVARLRDTLKSAVKQFCRTVPSGGVALIPPLRQRLAEAAGAAQQTLTDDDLKEFRGKLAGLVPGSFEPQGHGPLKILVSYPANSRNDQIEQYLRTSVHLPTGSQVVPEFRTTQAETIAVVLFRSSMGVTEVREVRDVLRTWASAQARQQPQDHLRWRQRTGYDFGYLATKEEHRVEILHRLLCALWNGKVSVAGDPKSPGEIAVVLGGGMRMTLPLVPLERASSWASVLRAYELWTLDDDTGFRGDFCAQLMQEVPIGITTRPAAPHENYLFLRDVADRELAVLDQLAAAIPETCRGRVHNAQLFWARTFPAALDQPFTGTDFPVRSCLRELDTVDLHSDIQVRLP
jgi:hypothetical protein